MLLVTPGRESAIENIRIAVSEGRFNDKTEPFDPQWDPEALKADIRARQEQFLKDTRAVRSYKGAIKKLIAMAARLTGSEQSFRSLIDTRMELRLCS